MINHEVLANSLASVGYGDAAGLPFEGQPPRQPRSVNGLRDTETNPYIGQYPAGTWSDDTHLSLAVAKSLIESNGFNLESQAKWHVMALDHVNGEGSESDLIPPIVTDSGHTGWGKGTTASVQRLKAGTPPTHSGQPDSAGNGVLMKMAPLVLWQVAAEVPADEADQQIIELTQMTHANAEAVIASLVHKRYIERLCKGETMPDGLLARSYNSASMLEDKYSRPRVLSRMLGTLSLGTFPDFPSRKTIFDLTPKKGFYAPETLAMAYGSFLIQPKAPRSIYRAVELGGDSDSIGSIVATLSLIASGVSLKGVEDYPKVYDVSRLERVGKELAAISLS